MSEIRALLFSALLLSSPALADTLELYAGLTPQHAVAADFNRDGRMDLAVASTFDDSVTIIHRTGSGNYVTTQTIMVGANSFPPSNFPRFLTIGDFNNDGAADLTVICSGNYAFSYEPSIQTLMNDGNGLFLPVQPSAVTPIFDSPLMPVQMVVGQFTNDSLDDVALANLNSGTIRILAGDGAGRFAIGPEIDLASTSDGPYDLAVADLDHDGLDDLVAVTEGDCYVVRQSPAGVFNSPVAYSVPAGAAQFHAVYLDDYDQDGQWDAAIADRNSRVVRLFGIDAVGGTLGNDVLNDASLNGCSDILSINWDGDWKPDIAVANLDGDTVTVFGSEGLVDVIPTALEPRRIESADMDGNGRLDLITANEGDESVSSNPDVNIILNAGSLHEPGSAIRRGQLPVAGRLGLRLYRPHALGVGSPTRVWAVENSRRAIQEFNPSPNLNANLAARLGDRLEFDFDIAGLAMLDHREGFVVERWAGRIHDFTVAAGIQSTVTLAETPGDLGFAGLARDPATGDFYVSDPSSGSILRFDSTGTLLGSFSLGGVPAGAMAWMPANSRLYVVQPGRTQVRAYDAAGTLDAAASFDLGASGSILQNEGLAGVGKVSNKDELYLLTTNGILAHASLDGTIQDVVSISPASEVIAMTYDTTNGLLFALGNDAHVTEMSVTTSDDGRLYSLWPAVVADPTFVPAGIAYDSISENFLVSDRTAPRYARFASNGNFLGFEDYSSTIDVAVSGGFDLDVQTGDMFLRDVLGVEATTTADSYPVPRSPITDLAYRMGSVAVGLPNPSEALVIPTNGVDEPYGVNLPEIFLGGGLAFIDDNTILHLGTVNAEHMTALIVAPPDPTGVSDWSLY
ncbi:VCBS repeat-containing protein [bacterium]|nr:VCBS repeat-containing protein [bacterium]